MTISKANVQTGHTARIRKDLGAAISESTLECECEILRATSLLAACEDVVEVKHVGFFLHVTLKPMLS